MPDKEGQPRTVTLASERTSETGMADILSLVECWFGIYEQRKYNLASVCRSLFWIGVQCVSGGDQLEHRVVVTGVGAVTPLGLDVSSTWDGLINGRSGANYITRFDSTDFKTKISCEVKGFDPTEYTSRKESRRMDRFALLALSATKQALDDGGLEVTSENADQIGTIIGTGIGGIETLSSQFQVLEKRGPDRVSPFLCTMMTANMAAAQVSIQLGVRGPNYCTVSACSSGAHAVGEAYESIRRGAANVILAGGTEAPVVPISVATFNSMRALSTQNDPPEKASRPFDAKRDGFVLGEGAAMLVVEQLEHALDRGAKILAEIVGYGATADASHVTAPAENGTGARIAMDIALKRGCIRPTDVDYVNAHGTSTQLNDLAETKAIKHLFCDHSRKLMVSSTKSMTGHLLGAAGAIEAIICILAIRNGIVPPTTNLENPDPECDLDYVPNTARQAEVRCAISNSLGFGGHNTSLVFVAPDFR